MLWKNYCIELFLSNSIYPSVDGILVPPNKKPLKCRVTRAALILIKTYSYHFRQKPHESATSTLLKCSNHNKLPPPLHRQLPTN